MTTFLFVANDPALDFVNTEVLVAGARTDLLQNFGDLTEWFVQANLAPSTPMQRLAKRWAGTAKAEASLQAARALRAVLRSAAEHVARSGHVPRDLANVLARELQQPRLATEVVQSQERLQTRPYWKLERPSDLLVPVAHHAASLFATADYSAIRKCEDPECILFFHDTTKNHSRRWCSMEWCGNRAKVAAFRERL